MPPGFDAALRSSRVTVISVLLYNPLPEALGHYERQAAATLRRAGVHVDAAAAANAEIGAAGVQGNVLRATRAVQHVRAARRATRLQLPVIALWPVAGWADIAAWSSRNCRTAVVVHDPIKLRRQLGLGRLGRTVARLSAGPRSPLIVSHSSAATTVIRDALPDSRIIQVRHPIADKRSSGSSTREHRSVVVLGQHKPARDRQLMAQLGPALKSVGFATYVYGRGWPSIPGWTVHEGFLSEESLECVMRSAAAVLLPYKFYFQSGVAIRCLEVGTKFVGGPTPFLSDLMGPTYAGYVADTADVSAWVDAVIRCIATTTDQSERYNSYAVRADSDWRELADELDTTMHHGG